jgi:DNA-binding PadR family transcriptional regulator
MPNQKMILTRVELHLLLVLLDGPRHGYGIMLDVETITDGKLRLGPGTLYTAIQRLVQSGLIEECTADAERRRCYRVTQKGKRVATAEVQTLSNLVRVARERGLIPALR